MSAASPPGPGAAREADRRASALSTRERDRPAPHSTGRSAVGRTAPTTRQRSRLLRCPHHRLPLSTRSGRFGSDLRAGPVLCATCSASTKPVPSASIMPADLPGPTATWLRRMTGNSRSMPSSRGASLPASLRVASALPVHLDREAAETERKPQRESALAPDPDRPGSGFVTKPRDRHQFCSRNRPAGRSCSTLRHQSTLPPLSHLPHLTDACSAFAPREASRRQPGVRRAEGQRMAGGPWPRSPGQSASPTRL